MSERIAPDLLPLAKPLDRFTEDPANLNEHDAESIDVIKASLERFGQRKPIVADRAGKVVAGNGTLVAARALGWETLAAVTFEDAEKALAYAIADNRTASFSDWDRQRISSTMLALSDRGVSLAGLGWTEAQVKAFLETQSEAPGSSGGGDGDGAAGPPPDDPPGTAYASTLEFPSEDDQVAFYTFVADLRQQFPEIESPGAVLVKWVGTL